MFWVIKSFDDGWHIKEILKLLTYVYPEKQKAL